MIRHRATWLLGATGLVLVAVGVVRVVATASGAGLVTVVVVGALLLVSPFIIARVERLSVSTSGFELRLTRDIAALGPRRRHRSWIVPILPGSPSLTTLYTKNLRIRSIMTQRYICRIGWLRRQQP